MAFTGSVPVMHQIGSRRRNQPAPPHVIFEALTQPDRDQSRPWLILLDDEQLPVIGDTSAPEIVHWTSLWPKRPDALIRFDLPTDGGGGTDMRWTLYIETPVPDESTIGHFRKRLNVLINSKLRNTFGQ